MITNVVYLYVDTTIKIVVQLFNSFTKDNICKSLSALFGVQMYVFSVIYYSVAYWNVKDVCWHNDLNAKNSFILLKAVFQYVCVVVIRTNNA